MFWKHCGPRVGLVVVLGVADTATGTRDGPQLGKALGLGVGSELGLRLGPAEAMSDGAALGVLDGANVGTFGQAWHNGPGGMMFKSGAEGYGHESAE